MDSRVVLDALSPNPHTFTDTLSDIPPASLTPLPTLRRSLKAHFPSPSFDSLTNSFNPTSKLSTQSQTHLVQISSLPDLQRAILAARSHRRRVRPSTGALQSSSNRRFLAAGGYILDLSPLTKLTHYPRRGVIVAQAAVTFRQLDSLRTTNRLHLPVHVPLSRQSRSIGAALARGASGAGSLDEGLLADHVVELSIVDASGRLRVISASDATGLFDAARLALGLFGVIFDVTIRLPTVTHVSSRTRTLTSNPFVRVTNRFVRLGAVFADEAAALRQLLDANARVELFWRPFNAWYVGGNWNSTHDAVWVRTLTGLSANERCPRAEEDEDVAFRILTLPQWLMLNAGILAQKGYTQFRLRDTKHLLALGFRETAWKLETKPFVQPTAHAAQLCHAGDSMPVTSLAVSIPVRSSQDDTWRALETAWNIVTELVEKADRKGYYPLNFGFRTTFTKSSTALLAPNYKYVVPGRRNSHSATLEILSAKHTRGWDEFAKTVADAWMQLPGARWHWSRESAKYVSWELVVNSLGDGLKNFKSLRKNAGVDDYGMFIDDELGDILDLLTFSEDMTISPVSSSGSGRMSARWRELDALLVKAQADEVNQANEEEIQRGSSSGRQRKRGKSVSFDERNEISSRLFSPFRSNEDLDAKSEDDAHSVDYDYNISKMKDEYTTPSYPVVISERVEYGRTVSRSERIMIVIYIIGFLLLWGFMFGAGAWDRFSPWKKRLMVAS